MSAPSWAPSMEQVAAYVTSRTVDSADRPGTDTPSQTFTPTTVPSSFQVTQIIADACEWVTAVTGVLSVTMYATASSVAALRAAGLVELTYPMRNSDVDTVSAQLLSQAFSARADLAAANRGTGQAGVSATASPRWSFPDPVGWNGDFPRA